MGIDKRNLYSLEIKVLQKLGIYTIPYLFRSPIQVFFLKYCIILPLIPPGVWIWYTHREEAINYKGLIIVVTYFSILMLASAIKTKKLQQQYKGELEQLRKKYCL
ncbi:MAG: hypothetical protein HQK50_02685 [Oligoflexia bacterium]|nr:hypothetical protein [Oligoflexia bacterium]